jgi:hypothetical protein
MNNEFILSGDDMELMGMGRSFLRRQASRFSAPVRSLSHQALNIAAKVPVTSGFVGGARALDGLKSSFQTKAKSLVSLPSEVSLKKDEASVSTPKSKALIYAGAAAAGLAIIYAVVRKKKG